MILKGGAQFNENGALKKARLEYDDFIKNSKPKMSANQINKTKITLQKNVRKQKTKLNKKAIKNILNDLPGDLITDFIYWSLNL